MPYTISKLFIFFLLCSYTTLYAQESHKVVKAQQGDGIYSLLRKAGLNPSSYYADFIALNKDRLNNGTELYKGKSYLLPLPDNTGSDNDELVTASSNGEQVTESNNEEQVVEVNEEEEETKSVQEENTAEVIQTTETTEANETAGTKYAIFGESRALVVPKSKRLNGTVYYLISGHGGPDPGAVEEYQGDLIGEDEYAYDVTLRLAKELLAHGAKVFVIVRDEDDGIRDERALVLDKDEVVYPSERIPQDQLARLKQRVDAVNKLYLKHRGRYQRLIVTHVDSRSKGENIDVFFYHHENSKNGKHLAESIHQTFQKKYKKHQPYRDYSGTFKDRTNLYMVKNTLPAMAYIEVGNIRNTKDQRRILDPNNRQAMANWIAQGILLDFENK